MRCNDNLINLIYLFYIWHPHVMFNLKFLMDDKGHQREGHGSLHNTEFVGLAGLSTLFIIA